MKRNVAFRLLTAGLAVVLVAAILIPIEGRTVIERWRETHSGEIVWRAPSPRPVVALTFDDGPDARYTPRVLGILKKRGVRATFFCCGCMVQAHPELVRQILADGHTLGNHTQNHLHVERAGYKVCLREIRQAEDRIRSATGLRTTLVRPPRGLWDEPFFRAARKSGYRIVLWTLAFDRERIHDSAALRRRVISLAKSGDIILMHDGAITRELNRESTVRELGPLIDGLRQRGFRFVTVPELPGPVRRVAVK